MLGGVDTLNNIAEIPQTASATPDGEILPVRMAQANNVYAPTNRYDLTTRLGFTKVNSSAISTTDIFTSIVHQGEIADTLLVTSSKAGGAHNIFNANNNPPTAVAGGTNFTIGQTNLVDAANFTDGTNPGTIFVSRLRDLPQFVDATPTRSNFTIAGTGLTSLKPAIMEIFFARALYGNVNRDGTVFDDRVYWSDIRDGNLITDHTTAFLSFETAAKDKIRALKKLSDLCIVGKLNNIFTMIPTPQATVPFTIQEEPGGRYKGPVGQHSTVETNQRLYWLGQVNIHSMDQQFRIRDHADIIKPTMLLLSSANLEYAVAGVDEDRNLVLFNVYNTGQTSADYCIALNYKTDALYIWTTRRNAYGHRLVSGDNRLIGGGLTGFLYTENLGSTGDLDDATAVIDADVMTPRHHCGQPTVVKLFGGIKIGFDLQGAEAVTVQYRLNDASAWTSFAASPYTVTGTAGDVRQKFFPLMKAGTHLQLRFRDTISGDAYRITKYTILWKPMTPGLV